MNDNPKVKSMMRGGNAKAFVDYLKVSGFPYTLKISNYNTEIISDLYNMQFIQSMRGAQCFAAAAKVKSDIKDLIVPIIDKRGLKYFDNNFKGDLYVDEVINIDLKSAYATAMLNNNLISQATFDYMGKIPKLDRLAALGMLAGKKYVFAYDNKNKLISYHKEVNEKEGFFYYCVQEVQRVMNDVQYLCLQDYLFTWVDGIYIKKGSEAIQDVVDYLEGSNYAYTIETLKDFRVEVKSGKTKIQFKKFSEKRKEYTWKYFNIPARPSMLAEDLVYYLTDKNVKNNEVLPVKGKW